MANSSIIKRAKNKIIKEFIKDKNIVQAINSSEITSPEKLKGTHIFPTLDIWESGRFSLVSKTLIYQGILKIWTGYPPGL